MRRFLGVGAAGILVALGWAVPARAQKPPLLLEKDVRALANELSGETAKRNLEGIARFHRQRGSKGFHEAAELVAGRLQAYGLGGVAILEFPADGRIFYGTQRSRPAWDAERGELEEIREAREGQDVGIAVKISSYEAEPVALAEDSESADVTADLVDVGEGILESDYAGRDVKGKIVLAGAQPGAVEELAVGKFGAAGIVSYAQNQKTAWWGEDENLIRWGHLETFRSKKTFAFMVSLKTARAMKERLRKGERIRLHAIVEAGQHPGNYEVVTATIPGADEKLKNEEIAFSCHLDHQRPGANDNASGCATILEVARTLEKLIEEKKLERPGRTIRFIFPPEIEGTLALLVGTGRYSSRGPGTSGKASEARFPGPELAGRLKAVIHMDMVGGGPETKSVFHVTQAPLSLPSFVPEVAWAFAEWVNEESYKFAATGQADYPLVAPEGGKEPLGAQHSPFTLGSDHDVYQDSSFGIPAIYLNDWPDRYIHTNFDSAANIDPTKLKRAAFIGAASGYALATMNRETTAQIRRRMESQLRLAREQAEYRNLIFSREEQDALNRARASHDAEVPGSLNRFAPPGSSEGTGMSATNPSPVEEPPHREGGGGLKFRRRPEPQGPLSVFGYDYFADKAKAQGVTSPKLLGYQGLWGAGEEYAYEVLNSANGRRSAQEIRDLVSAEYGPVPLELVLEYLRDLEKIGVVENLH